MKDLVFISNEASRNNRLIPALWEDFGLLYLCPVVIVFKNDSSKDFFISPSSKAFI
jgi:hypothetical protein